MRNCNNISYSNSLADRHTCTLLLSVLLMFMLCPVISNAAGGTGVKHNSQRDVLYNAELFSNGKFAYLVQEEADESRSIWATNGKVVRNLQFTNPEVDQVQKLITVTDQHLFFTATNPLGDVLSLWRANATARSSEAEEMIRIPLIPEGFALVSFDGNVNNEMIFSSYRSNGDEAPERRFYRTVDNGSSITENNVFEDGDEILAIGDDAFLFRYFATGESFHPQLWKLNATAGTPEMVFQHDQSAYVFAPKYDVVSGDNSLLYYFVLDSALNTWTCDLWRSDGTTAGTFLVGTENLGYSSYVCPDILAQHNDRLYFERGGYPLGMTLVTSAGEPQDIKVLLSDLFVGEHSVRHQRERDSSVMIGSDFYLTARKYRNGRKSNSRLYRIRNEGTKIDIIHQSAKKGRFLRVGPMLGNRMIVSEEALLSGRTFHQNVNTIGRKAKPLFQSRAVTRNGRLAKVRSLVVYLEFDAGVERLKSHDLRTGETRILKEFE